jgi:hypothetical protein
MPERRQFSVGGKPPEEVLLPYRVVTLKIVRDTGRQNEEAAIDPSSVSQRLLAERRDLVAVQLKRSEPTRRLYGRHCCDRALVAVKLEQPRNVHVSHAVAVRKKESVVVGDVVETRLRRPPVAVSSTVSTRVTRQGSAEL